MNDLREAVDRARLAALREAYRPEAMSQANVVALSRAYPPLSAWIEQTSDTFFGAQGTLAPRDRERCIIALLAYTGPPMSLAVHVYWGLMEGLSLDEVCAAVGLAACYGGLPRAAQGVLVVSRLATLLNGLDASSLEASHVLDAMVREFGR